MPLGIINHAYHHFHLHYMSSLIFFFSLGSHKYHHLYATLHADKQSRVAHEIMWEQTEERNMALVRLSHTVFCIQTEEKRASQKWIVIWEGHNIGGD